MTDRELLELIAAQVGKLTTDVDGFKNDLADVKNYLTDVKSDIKKIHMTIEHNIRVRDITPAKQKITKIAH